MIDRMTDQMKSAHDNADNQRIIGMSPAKIGTVDIGIVEIGTVEIGTVEIGTAVIGKTAPAFSLPDNAGNMVSLKDFKGKSAVVLYFYPKAMTPGCTVQACGLRDSKKELTALGAVALGISPDPVARLQKFADRDKLNFILLSDEDHAVANKYGVWGLKKFMGREFMGIRRTTFIIDKSGKLVHIMDKVNTKTHHNDVISILKSL